MHSHQAKDNQFKIISTLTFPSSFIADTERAFLLFVKQHFSARMSPS
jgi:hypothetical protein